MKDCIKIVIFSLLAILIVGGIVCCGIWFYECETQYQEYTYTLEELEEDVYGIYQTVVSSIPAQNYTMITICCDGNVKTIKGVIQICYTEETPKIIYIGEAYGYKQYISPLIIGPLKKTDIKS